MFPLESVVPFHHNWESSGVKLKHSPLIIIVMVHKMIESNLLTLAD